MAALARRPFVALSSNTFKVEGLLEGFPELSPVEPDATAIADAEKRAERSPGRYERFFDHLAAQRPLSTFAALGGHPDPGGEHRELQKLAERYRIPVAHREVRPSVPDPAAFGRDVPGGARAFPTAGNWTFVLIATGGLVLSALTCASE